MSEETQDKKFYLDANGLIRFAANVIAKLNGKADVVHNHDDEYYDIQTIDEKIEVINDLIDSANEVIDLKLDAVDFNESIIGLSIDGRIVTYIKADGTSHSFETQDTDTTYSLGTDTVTGLTKLYATTGSAEDGTMTQKAITTELNKKVGVTMDNTQNTLVFTI